MSDTTQLEDLYPGDLQLDQDLAVQRREWRLQRAGWGIMMLTVLLALLGFTGYGPFSHTRVANADPGVVADYQRVNRFRAPCELRLRIEQPQDELTVTIPAALADRIRLRRVVPKPTNSYRSVDYLRLEYRDLQPRGGALLVVIEYQTVRVGWLRGVVLVNDQPAVDLQSIVLP